MSHKAGQAGWTTASTFARGPWEEGGEGWGRVIHLGHFHQGAGLAKKQGRILKVEVTLR